MVDFCSCRMHICFTFCVNSKLIRCVIFLCLFLLGCRGYDAAWSLPTSDVTNEVYIEDWQPATQVRCGLYLLLDSLCASTCQLHPVFFVFVSFLLFGDEYALLNVISLLSSLSHNLFLALMASVHRSFYRGVAQLQID